MDRQDQRVARSSLSVAGMQAEPQFTGTLGVVDIPRKKVSKKGRNLALAIGGVVVLVGITIGLSRLKSAAPTIDRGSVWTDTVKRGEMLRQVKGPGTLVPEQIRWITADTAGRVERIPLRPGARVEADTVLMELSNPDVMLQALDAERQLAQAQADLLTLRTNLEGQRLTSESTLAQLRTDSSDASRRAAANRPLAKDGTISGLEAQVSFERDDELRHKMQLEQQRLNVLGQSTKDQLAAQTAQIERLRAVVQFRRKLVESMRVKAGGPGVLSELPLELGQWVTPGSLLAKVVQPEKLKAELRIPETQAKDVALQLPAEIDTRNGVVKGVVSRIAPSANQGTVLVEVRLQGELPRGARPDLTVEGTLEIEKLSNTLFVGRPAGAQPDSIVELFRLDKGDDLARRTKVKLGRSSVSTIEIVEGLTEGDTVVLSDMSAWDTADRVRLR